MPLDSVPEAVTLKKNGKAFKCEFPAGRKRCGGKEFAVANLGEPDEYYLCLKCSTAYSVMDGFVALLPPRNDWRTPGGTAMRPQPGGLWTTLHEEYRYTVDLAASALNSKCPIYLDGATPLSDALIVDWSTLAEDVRGWGNCPYQPKGAIRTWLEKAVTEAAKGVFSTFLIPMSTSVEWFNELVIPYAEWHSFKGRIPFEDPLADGDPEAERTSPKQDNLLVIYDPYSEIIGHTAVRDAKTGRRLWTRP